jgi:hypothetical protein
MYLVRYGSGGGIDGAAHGGVEVTELHGGAEAAVGAPNEEPDRWTDHPERPPSANGGSKGKDGVPKRPFLVVLIVLGAALIIMPFAFTMFSRAPKGAAMLSQFKPFMTTARLNGFQEDIRQINAGVHQADTGVATFLTARSGGGAARAQFDAAYPTFAQFSGQWGAIDAQMTDLLDKVQGNLPNYEAVAALPSFTLFPLFFVIPGALVLFLAGASLLRATWWRTCRWILVVLGVGLVLAPVVFGMFQRAPKGGQMISAFRSIETTHNVEQIQGYFGTMVVGQGAIRLELVPALQQAGLTSAQIQAMFPAVYTLDQRWVHILNDMTPMIGAMSDNVANYQGIAALPPFPLFPYFFVLPGLLVAGTAIAAGPRLRRRSPIE